ncbi:unnamed protein product [Clonostachys rhizophaga]|uniref:Uncharacterized protein n=1 Tax=Clonostachys rhizophaga TaxID=160324 RepID=A0A9N9VZD0_9HYPO|nr:unnamed protein product [Clonostachys rhizophaga]
MKKRGFSDLPRDVQDAIWELVLRDIRIRHHPKKPLDLGRTLAIAAVNQSARICVFRVGIHRLINRGLCARSDTHWGIFLPDLDKHTLTVSADAFYQYPGIIEPKRQSQGSEQGSHTVAILRNARRLIIYDERSEILCQSISDHLAEGSSGLLKAKDALPRRLRSPIDFITNELGDLSGDFARLESVTYVGKQADWSWWMGDEYRVHGPEVVSRPPSQPHGTKSHGEYENMVGYFEERGISDDTGIEWGDFSGFTIDPREQWDFRRCWKDIPKKWRVNPKIGLRGFSYNSSSCGGVWAGFRLYLGESPRLEFSPLHWEDVKQYMYSFQTTSSGNPLPAIAHGPNSMPLRSSPHHCWEPVDGAFDSIGDTQGVDWRAPVDFSIPHPSWDPEEYMNPEFDGALSSEQQKELRYFNRHRILTLFNLVVLQKLYNLGLPDFSLYEEE